MDNFKKLGKKINESLKNGAYRYAHTNQSFKAIFYSHCSFNMGHALEVGSYLNGGSTKDYYSHVGIPYRFCAILCIIKIS